MSGVSGLQQGITSINRLKRAIRELPKHMQESVAEDAAGYLDIKIREDFAKARTVYDTPRPLSVDGKPLSLVRTGMIKQTLAFTAIGTIVRAELSTKYARYLIGKYKILPQRLPVAWRQYLETLVQEYRDIELERAGARPGAR